MLNTITMSLFPIQSSFEPKYQFLVIETLIAQTVNKATFPWVVTTPYELVGAS